MHNRNTQATIIAEDQHKNIDKNDKTKQKLRKLLTEGKKKKQVFIHYNICVMT